MEVLTFFTNSRDIPEAFDEFIYSYPKLNLSEKDKDTAYFINPLTCRNEIYYHFILNNINDEFSYNYTQEEQFRVISFIGSEEFYFFDIQYREESFLKEMIISFDRFLISKGIKKKILIHHPHNGFIEMKNYII